MANPFLVLGGIAIGIITAGFGVLAVPGWVASAQDAAAQNDLGNAVAAHSAAVSQTGKAATSLGALKSGHGLRFEESNGVKLDTYANGANWGLVAHSPSGAVFAKVSGFGQVFRGENLAALKADPAFKQAWAAAALPPVGDAEAPVDDDATTATTVRYSAEAFRVTAVFSSDGQTGSFAFQPNAWFSEEQQDVYYVKGTVNGVEVLSGAFNTVEEMSAAASSGQFRAAWDAAGLGPLDVSGGNAAFAGSETFFNADIENPTTTGTKAAAALQWTGLSAMDLTPYDGANIVGYQLTVRGDANTKALVATAASGFSIGVVSDEGSPRTFTADSADALIQNAAFQRALSDAGITV